MLKTLAFLGIVAFAGHRFLKNSASHQAPSGGGQPHRGTTKLFRSALEPKKGAAADMGHRPDDLEGDQHPDGSTRANEHFRPDIHGTVDPEDRESLRPVTMKSARGPAGV